MSKHEAHINVPISEGALQYKENVNKCSSSESCPFIHMLLLNLSISDLKTCNKFLQCDIIEALRHMLRVYHRYTVCIYSTLVSIPVEPRVGERQGLVSPLFSMPSQLNRKRQQSYDLSQKMFLSEHAPSAVCMLLH